MWNECDVVSCRMSGAVGGTHTRDFRYFLSAFVCPEQKLLKQLFKDFPVNFLRHPIGLNNAILTTFAFNCTTLNVNPQLKLALSLLDGSPWKYPLQFEVSKSQCGGRSWIRCQKDYLQVHLAFLSRRAELAGPEDHKSCIHYRNFRFFVCFVSARHSKQLLPRSTKVSSQGRKHA